MNNNFTFRSTIHLHGLSQDKNHLEKIFSLGGMERVSARKIRGWRADAESKSYIPMPDKALTAFFDGLFKLRNQRRNEGVNVWALSAQPLPPANPGFIKTTMARITQTLR